MSFDMTHKQTENFVRSDMSERDFKKMYLGEFVPIDVESIEKAHSFGYKARQAADMLGIPIKDVRREYMRLND